MSQIIKFETWNFVQNLKDYFLSRNIFQFGCLKDALQSNISRTAFPTWIEVQVPGEEAASETGETPEDYSSKADQTAVNSADGNQEDVREEDDSPDLQEGDSPDVAFLTSVVPRFL